MPDDAGLSRRDLLRRRLLARVAYEATKALGAVEGAFAKSTTAFTSSAPAGPSSTGVGRRFALPIHRPPGAVDEVSFLAGCTRCKEGITACPNVLHFERSQDASLRKDDCGTGDLPRLLEHLADPPLDGHLARNV